MSRPEHLLSNEQLLEVLTLTKTATAVHVTEDAIIQMANDAMISIWGKDRSVIGKSLEDALPELKGQPFIDLFKRVWNEGLTISGSDTPADLVLDGVLKTFYFDFEYRAIKDAAGKTYAILHSAVDVTERFLRVEAQQRTREKEEALVREQALNEELAATNEELSTINEKLQQTRDTLATLNNELEHRVSSRTKDLAESVEREQALNEELRTSNEEMLAINEELFATNNDLKESQENLKRLNQELHHSEQRLDEILRQLPTPVLVLRGPDHIIELTNQALLTFWHKTSDEVTGKPMLEVFPELTEQRFPAQWRHVFDTGELVTNIESPVYFTTPDGAVRLSYVDTFYQPLKEFDGKITGVLTTLIDVTNKVESRRQLEQNQEELQALNDELSSINEEMTAANEELLATNQELAETQSKLQKRSEEIAASEARFRLLVKNAPVAISILNGPELRIESSNDKMLHLIGKDASIIGKTFSEALPEMEGQRFAQMLIEIFFSGETFYDNESRTLLERDGKLVEGYFNAIYQPLRDEAGNVASIMIVAIEVTEQVLARAKVQRAEEMLRFSIEASNVGTWFMDAATRNFLPSARLKELYGFRADEEMTAAQAIAQIPEPYRDQVADSIEAVMAEHIDFKYEHPVIGFHDQKLRWIRAEGKLYTDDNGKNGNFSGLAIEITEQKQDEQRKNDFIGMVSHELKTPLTSLSAYVQMLHGKAKNNGDVFTSGALEKVSIQVSKMSKMINGFLNISRLESGKIQLEKQTFNLDELITNMIDETKLTTTGHAITLTPCEIIEVNADKDKIGSVISNLLSNAVKYSSRGTSITVNCEIQDSIVQVSVNDQGMGIEQKDLGNLFDRYYRVDNPNYKHISGFGIGLYLSAEIVQRHDGKIWVESEMGKGSTFYFTLPKV